MSDPEVLSAGQALGRYELLSQVARGGMGEVWAARLKGPRGFQKLVAIKTLLPELRHDPRIEQMLLEEARIASAIQHPHVVQTTELGEHRGYLYLVMEWIDGEALSFVLKRGEERGAMPIPVAVNLVAQACRGLHAAHELTSDLGVPLGVVHRDVSPHNILVTHTGVVKLVDFGIAKAMNQNLELTDHGEIKGKYAYMAPEQVLGEEVDRRADVFSLAITLYILTTGQHPFKMGDKTSVIRAITSDAPPPPPSSIAPGYPLELEKVLLKALEKAPDQRFATAEAFRAALEAAVPAAFAPRFEVSVKEFLAKTMGDRAEARREALRRFQLAADERRIAEVAAGVIPAQASQSAGSLRAIMVDNVPVAIEPQPLERRLSDIPTAPGRRQKPRRALAFATAGVALAALAVVFARQQPLRSTAQGSPAPLATLPSPVVAEPAPTVVPQVTATTPAAPAPSAAPASSASAAAA
ncbi:MAG TPA: serine/threonine-protein kinase, partial [Polyangiaceae bacterium]|nr:serine/threonine-protein kinase [Polyangiaceae bacterium]